ncbi:amp deaminase [Cystoisospora suis]|uniref:Amp deaminase n=1 Tax=Cystoisospora suis TaxID=483139 RepID=A0A2C6KRR9_9APIC|nr:amp deaminase [Cystoisospora suis]
MSSTMTGENAPHESAVDGKPAVELDSSGKGVTDRRTDNPFSSAGEGRTTVMKSGSELSLSLSRRDTGVERSQSINTREEDEETQASSIDAMKSFDSSISPTPDAQTLRPRDGAQAGLPGAFGKRGEGLRENDSSPEMEKRHVPSVPPSSFARYAATTGPSLEVPSQERGGHSDWNGGVGPLVAVRYASDSVLPSSSSSSSSATARGLLHHPVGGKEVDRHGNKSAVSGDDVISHTASCTSQCLGVPRRADAGLLDGTVDATHEGGKIDDEKMGWSYMFKKLLSLNFKDAGAVTYLDKLPTVPAKAGSAAAAAVSPALGPLSSASATRRSVAPPLPPTQSIGSNAVCLPGAQQPQQGLAGGLGYVRMVPSKDLAVASSVCDESVEAVRLLAHALQLRQSWSFAFPEPPRSHAVVLLTEQEKATRRSHEPLYDPTKIPLLPPCNAQFRMVDGVYNVFWDPNTDGSSTTGKRESMHDEQDSSPPLLWADHPIPDVLQFLRALKDIMTAVQNPACKSFCYKRLKYLEGKFNLHLMFNAPAEVAETKYNFHRDFYNVRKVDTHIHHSACMQQKHLLRFIRKKYRTEADTYVAKTRDGREQTLKDMFHSEVGICAHDASVDHLDVHALGSCFQRFDLFNQKYNPFGQRTLRDVFLKTDNYIEGRFLAEITREVISDLEERRYQHVEWRLSIYGRSRDEWAKLAKWVVKNKLFSARVRWMIQVPRLYHVYKRLGMISSFGDLLSNVFEPLFEAVRNPSENPDLFTFLSIIVGWDSVDDESYASKYTMEGGELPRPEDWTGENNPPYSYWGYYMYANIRALNHLLTARGMRPLAFRPHCGEAGSVSHLATMFLLADAINHGIMLKKCPVLQFLFYLAQIGLAVSPLSNNALFMDIGKHPRVPLYTEVYTDATPASWLGCGISNL